MKLAPRSRVTLGRPRWPRWLRWLRWWREGGLPVLAAAGAAMTLSGCESTGAAKAAGAATGGEIVVVPPAGEGWQEVETVTGRYFVKAVDGMADIVSLFVLSSMPGTQGVASLDQLEAMLQIDRGGTYHNRTRGDVFGVPVIRYESLRKSPGDADGIFQQALGLGPRPSSYTYATREIGVFFLHPHKPGHVVRVGCARTSYHGLLGTHFEAEAKAFAEQVILESTPDPVY